MRWIPRIGSIFLLIMATVACERDKAPVKAIPSMAGSSLIRAQDPVLIETGQQIYRQHCLVCHGDRAQGDPNWRKKGPDGLWPPPPLNGEGHAWHHPADVLRRMILMGSPRGKGNMPAWEGKLSDNEVDAVIAWLQSLWPDEIYAIWRDREQNILNK